MNIMGSCTLELKAVKQGCANYGVRSKYGPESFLLDLLTLIELA